MRKNLLTIAAAMLLGPFTAFAQDEDSVAVESEEAAAEMAFDDFDFEDNGYTYFDTSSALNIDTNDNYEGFDLLKPAIEKGYRVYFTGENHTFTESNSLLQLKMFKYLHQNAGVNTLFMEFGFSRGYYVNKYIQTGDTAMLNVLRGYSFLEFADMYKGLMEYNKTLPEGEKIKVVGIDVERHFPLAVKTMSVSLPDEAPPAEIMLQVESLKGLARFFDSQAEKKLEAEDKEGDEIDYSDYYKVTGYNAENTMEDIIDNFKEYDSIYRVYLKDKYELYKKIALGLEQREVWNKYTNDRMPQAYIFREQYMYKEFMSNLKANPNDKFFAQFGRCHVSVILQEEACSWHEYNSIAQRLNNSTDSTINGKVCTIAIFYPKDKSDEELYNKYECVRAYMDAAADSGMTIFNILNTEDSCANLYKKYQYVIINRYKANPAYFGYQLADLFEEIEEDDLFVQANMLEFTITQRNFDFTNINNHFAKYLNAPQLAEDISGVGIYYHNINKKGFSSRFGFNFYKNSNLDLTNNSSVKFSFSSFGLLLGKDIFSNSFFDLVPHAGFQLGEFTLNYKADTFATNSASTLFREKSQVTYSNTHVALEANITMLYRVKGRFGIGAEVGYVYDMFNSRWKTQNQTLSNSPKQNGSGLYSSVIFTVDFARRKPKPTYEDYYGY